MNANRRCRIALVAGLVLVILGPRSALADGAAGLGRIFMSPEQRRALDEQRARLRAPDGGSLPRDLMPAGMSTERRLVFNGMVRRSDAPPVVWINGKPVSNVARLRHGPDGQGRVTVRSADGGASARLKPGQAWDPATGKVTDCTQCGASPQVEGQDAAAEPAAANEAQPGTAAAPALASTGPTPAAAQGVAESP
jgi:hypothetical protein